MRIRAAVVVSLIVFPWATSGFAQGTARSLDIQPGARQNALGAAGVALVSDPADAMWWNPAALAFAPGIGVRYTYARLLPDFVDLPYHHVAGGASIRDGLGVGASGTFLSYGTSTVATNFGWATSRSSEWSWAGAVGYRIAPGLALGLTAKYVKVNYLTNVIEGSTVAFDVGGLYVGEFPFVRSNTGFNVQNIGPGMKFKNLRETDPLSRNLKVGEALTVPIPVGDRHYELGGTLVFDFNQSLVTSDFRTYHVGLEPYVAFGRLARIAGRVGYYDDPLGDIGDATYGGGVYLAGLSADYAAIPEARDSGLPRVEKWTFGADFLALVEALGGR